MTNHVTTQQHDTDQQSREEGLPTRRGHPTDPIVDALVNHARAAQRQIEEWSEARIDAILRALANAVAEQAHDLAVATVAETGMGNVRDKTLKNAVASTGIYAHWPGKSGTAKSASTASGRWPKSPVRWA